MAESALLVVLALLLITAVGVLLWGGGRIVYSIVRYYLRERTPKLEFQHPVYGLLIGEEGIWSGSARIGNQVVPFALDGDAAVPKPSLIAQLDSIISRLSELEGQAVDFLRSKVADLAKVELELYQIVVSQGTRQNNFVLEFVVAGDDSRGWQVWRVEFEAGKPTSFGFDD
jgi:hypothetical protein